MHLSTAVHGEKSPQNPNKIVSTALLFTMHSFNTMGTDKIHHHCRFMPQRQRFILQRACICRNIPTSSFQASLIPFSDPPSGTAHQTSSLLTFFLRGLIRFFSTEATSTEWMYRELSAPIYWIDLSLDWKSVNGAAFRRGVVDLVLWWRDGNGGSDRESVGFGVLLFCGSERSGDVVAGSTIVWVGSHLDASPLSYLSHNSKNKSRA